MEYAPDVYDGAVPFMVPQPLYTEYSSVMTLARLVLGPRIAEVIDAVEPGGQGDPFAGLDSEQRQVLALLYAVGYPRGSEYLLALPPLVGGAGDPGSGADPTYAEDFWTVPGTWARMATRACCRASSRRR
jgi:hypothetical protein